MEKAEYTKNTIIYGGAFNPPTRAHQAILQACIDYAEQLSVDAEVWLMPSGDRVDKKIEASYADRLELLSSSVRIRLSKIWAGGLVSFMSIRWKSVRRKCVRDSKLISRSSIWSLRRY